MCNLKKHKQEHEDPMGDCLGEKRYDNHSFSIELGNCRIKTSFKKGKDHSETLITYKDISGAIVYPLNYFENAQNVFSEKNSHNLEDEEDDNKKIVLE
jgi:hypothetical protein